MHVAITGSFQTHFNVIYKVFGEHKMRHITCVCRKNITASYRFAPDSINFSSSTDELQTAVVNVSSARATDLTVTRAACALPAFSTNWDAKTNRVTLTFDPTKWSESDSDFDHQLKVRTSCNPDFDCPIPVYVSN